MSGYDGAMRSREERLAPLYQVVEKTGEAAEYVTEKLDDGEPPRKIADILSDPAAGVGL